MTNVRLSAALSALALLGLSACSLGGGTATTPPPSPAASSSAAASPTPIATAAASCRLPVASGDAPTDGNPAHGATGHGGFLQLPAGTFTADPASLASYDLAVHRWLPVPRAWVSPDGGSYAWPEYRSAAGPATGVIHVTSAATGADRTITVPAPSMPVSWETAGLYVTRVVPNSDAPPQGLSLVDPATGALKQVTPSGAWRVIGTGSAYGVDLDSGAAPPAQAGPGAGNRLNQVDLATGATHAVQTFPGTNVTILGIQGDTPVLLLQTADRSQVKVAVQTLYDQPVAQPPPGAPVVIDGAAIWLSGSSAIWRGAGSGPLQRIAVPLQVAAVAGACR